MKTIRINDNLNTSGGFMKMPNVAYGLLSNKEVGLKPVDLVVYTTMLNRLSLSLANADKFNNDGEMYVVYEQKDLMKELSLSNRGVSDSIKRLDGKLIKVTRHGKNKPNTYAFYDIFNMTTEQLTLQIVISGNDKMSSQDITNCHGSNTDISKTDINNIKDTATAEKPPASAKGYTALRDGGIACKIYSQEYELHFDEQHPLVETNKLDEIEERLQTFIEKESIDIMELPSIFEFHFTNLKNEKNGAIHYLAKDNYGYTPLLTKLLEEYGM